MKRLLAVLMLGLLGALAIASPANSESLGIGVTIMPDPQNPSVSSRNILWFGAEPGETATRTLRISSQSEVDQTVRFALLDLVIIDGEEFVNSDGISERDAWLDFEPSALELSPGETKEVQVTVQVPTNAEETTSISFLRVSATASSLDLGETGQGSRAVLPGGAGIDLETWIGVGDPELLLPSFELLNPRGIIRDGEKFIQSGFRNTGSIPLFITGALTLNDQTFAGRTFGPYDYQVSGIESNETGTFEVSVPEEIQEGPWQIYITSKAGNVVENRIFTLNLTFSEEGQFDLEQVVIPLVILILVGALVFAFRLIMQGRKERIAKNSHGQTSAPRYESSELDAVKAPSALKFRKLETQRPAAKPKAPVSTLASKQKESSRAHGDTRSDFDLQLDSWAESLRSSIREVRADSTDLVEKYKDVPTRKPRKPKAKD